LIVEQNPFGPKPIVKRALILCPASLIKNWKNEFQKWLGRERVRVFCYCEGENTEIRDFIAGNVYQVLVCGYEKVLLY